MSKDSKYLRSLPRAGLILVVVNKMSDSSESSVRELEMQVLSPEGQEGGM